MYEFAANNAVSDSTQVLSLFANFGWDPRMKFDLEGAIENPEQAREHKIARNLWKIDELVKVEMAAAQDRPAVGCDKSWRPTPTFEPGNEVLCV